MIFFQGACAWTDWSKVSSSVSAGLSILNQKRRNFRFFTFPLSWRTTFKAPFGTWSKMMKNQKSNFRSKKNFAFKILSCLTMIWLENITCTNFEIVVTSSIFIFSKKLDMTFFQSKVILEHRIITKIGRGSRSEPKCYILFSLLIFNLLEVKSRKRKKIIRNVTWVVISQNLKYSHNHPVRYAIYWRP